MIQSVRLTQFRTSDGKLHNTRADALAHETRLTLERYIVETLGVGVLMAEEVENLAAHLTAKTSPVLVVLKTTRKETL